MTITPQQGNSSQTRRASSQRSSIGTARRTSTQRSSIGTACSKTESVRPRDASPVLKVSHASTQRLSSPLNVLAAARQRHAPLNRSCTYDLGSSKAKGIVKKENSERMDVTSTPSFTLGDLASKRINAESDHAIKRAREQHSEVSKASVFSSLASLRQQVDASFRTMPMFAACCEDFVKRLVARVHHQTLSEGQWLATEGSPGNSLLVVENGKLQAVSDGSALFTIDAGQPFAETNFVGVDDKWPVSLVAVQETRIYQLPHEIFEATLRTFPTERSFFGDMVSKIKGIRSNGILTKTCGILECLKPPALERLNDRVIHKLYFPGEVILKEGSPGDSLVILVRGNCSVEIVGRAMRHERCTGDVRGSSLDGDLTAPVLFGELELLSLTTCRSASVVAQTCCMVRELPRVVLLNTMRRFRQMPVQGTALELLSQGSQIRKEVEDAFKNSLEEFTSFFTEANCSSEFLGFLHQHLEDRLFLTDRVIVDESIENDKCMYFLRHGRVSAVKDDNPIALLGPGSVFGELAVLGMTLKRMTSYVASSVAVCKVLHQNVVVRALELFPDERRKVLAMAFKKSTRGVWDGQGGEGGSDEDAKLGLADDSILKTLKTIGIFKNMDGGFVDELRAAAIDRIYMPDEVIIREGDKGESMFIMVSGSAVVFVADSRRVAGEGLTSQAHSPEHATHEETENMSTTFDPKSCIRIGELKPGGVSGELAVLGVSQIRSATIQAQSICILWEITQETTLSLLEKYPKERAVFADIIVSHLERTVPSRLLQMRLFKDFDRKFCMLLGLYCERKAFFPGQTVVREGEYGDKMLVVNLGMAELIKRGFCIKLYPAGSYVGAGNMLGICKTYSCTLVVSTMSHILCIPRIAYVQALDKYAAPKAAQEIKSAVQAAEKELRDLAERVTARMMILKRYQHGDKEEDPKGTGSVKQRGQQARMVESTQQSILSISGLDLMIMVTQAWASFAQNRASARRRRIQERLRYEKSFGHWKKKKDEREMRLQPKRIMDELVRRNVDARGPLLLPEQLPFEDLVKARQQELPGAVEAVAEASRSTSVDARRGGAASPSSESLQLLSLLRDWPMPRQSKHYRLRVWDVLANQVEESKAGSSHNTSRSCSSAAARSNAPSQLLPLLVSACSPPPADVVASLGASAPDAKPTSPPLPATIASAHGPAPVKLPAPTASAPAGFALSEESAETGSQDLADEAVAENEAPVGDAVHDVETAVVEVDAEEEQHEDLHAEEGEEDGQERHEQPDSDKADLESAGSHNDVDVRNSKASTSSAESGHEASPGTRRRRPSERLRNTIFRLAHLEPPPKMVNLSDVAAKASPSQIVDKLHLQSLPKEHRKSLLIAAHRCGLGEAIASSPNVSRPSSARPSSARPSSGRRSVSLPRAHAKEVASFLEEQQRRPSIFDVANIALAQHKQEQEEAQEDAELLTKAAPPRPQALARFAAHSDSHCGARQTTLSPWSALVGVPGVSPPVSGRPTIYPDGVVDA